MLVLVDGTSHDIVFRTREEYDLQFRGGFCQRIATELGGRQAVYFQGPKVLGLETSSLARQVATVVKGCPAGEPVFLCGYSRGGAAVIAAAKRVSRRIEALFLFDAVDRTLDLSTDTIPKNVAHVYHAIRDPKFAEKYEAEVEEKAKDLARKATTFTRGLDFPTFTAAASLISSGLKDLDHKYRKHRYTAFGNTGLKADPPCRVHVRKFSATHGAMGGIPWAEVDTDSEISRQVGVWMNSKMQLHGYQNFLGR